MAESTSNAKQLKGIYEQIPQDREGLAPFRVCAREVLGVLGWGY